MKKKTSLYQGVLWEPLRRKWRARARINGKQVHLGYFTSEIDAALAYNRKMLELDDLKDGKKP